MAGGLDGVALGSIAAGGLLVYAAITGKTVLGEVRAVIKGGSPATAKATELITGTPGGATGTGDAGGGAGQVTGDAGVGGGSNQKILQSAAAKHGWGTGAQWQALQGVEMIEAGFSATVLGPETADGQAIGIAQALGHGTAHTAGTLGNQYGGYGLTDAQAAAANSGDPVWQSIWMCNYIATVYGNPVNALQHEHDYGYY